MTCFLRALAPLATALALMICNTSLPAQSFFAPPAPPPAALPVNQIFPRGRVFPFIGFSGKAQWQKDNGYTAFGPVYGDTAAQQKGLAEAKAAGLPFIYRVGLEMNFLSKGGNPPLQMKPKQVHDAIAKQAEAAMADPTVCWWYVTPEELRFWGAAEMEYLESAKKALTLDPNKRPV